MGGGYLAPDLYLDLGDGFDEANVLRLPTPVNGRLEALLELPYGIRRARLDPLSSPGKFVLEDLKLEELGTLAALKNAAGRIGRDVRSRMRGPIPRGDRSTADVEAAYPSWFSRFGSPRPGEGDWLQRGNRDFAANVRFGVLVAERVGGTSEFCRTLRELAAQVYPNFDVNIASEGSKGLHDNEIRSLLGPDRPFTRTFIDAPATTGGLLGAAAAQATAPFLVTAENVLLPRHALICLARALATRPGADIVYADDDLLDADGRHHGPRFKPDWSPERLCQLDWLGPLLALRSDLVRRAGRFDASFGPAAVFDLTLRATRLTEADRILHLPVVLGSRRTPVETEPEHQRAVKQTLSRDEPRVEIIHTAVDAPLRIRYPLADPAPTVSIIIPTRNRAHLLRQCIESVRTLTCYPAYEILVIDNGTNEPDALQYLASIRRLQGVRVVVDDRPFNFSELNNDAAKMTDSTLLCFLNNDTEAVSDGWLRELVTLVQRPGVGAVGPKLLYPNGRIQHAGVVVGMMGLAAHLYRGAHRADRGLDSELRIVREVSALTAACLVVPRELFHGIGGFEQTHLPVAFSDVDLCLRLRESGLRLLWTPHAELIHHESVSRGPDSAPEHRGRLAREAAFLRRTWNRRLQEDPYFNRNLSTEREMPLRLSAPPRHRHLWEFGG